MTNQLDASDPGSNLALAKTINGIAADAAGVNVRLGTVISFNSATAKVAVSGSPVLQDAAYVLSPHYRPCIGDTVVLVRYGASWVCMGAVSLSPADNLVFNGSFEVAPTPGATPTGWGLTIESNGIGAPVLADFQQAVVAALGADIDGQWACQLGFVSSSVNGDSDWYLYSNPIPVIPQETYAGYVYVRGRADNFTAPECFTEVQVALGWYANPTTTTPLSINSGQPILGNFGGVNWEQLMCFNTPNGFVVPAGANYMRLHLYQYVFVPSYMPAPPAIILVQWDRAVVRKIYNADGSLAVVP